MAQTSFNLGCFGELLPVNFNFKETPLFLLPPPPPQLLIASLGLGYFEELVPVDFNFKAQFLTASFDLGCLWITKYFLFFPCLFCLFFYKYFKILSKLNYWTL